MYKLLDILILNQINYMYLKFFETYLINYNSYCKGIKPLKFVMLILLALSKHQNKFDMMQLFVYAYSMIYKNYPINFFYHLRVSQNDYLRFIFSNTYRCDINENEH